MRFRLIPAGEFLMGSPGDDGEAYDDERPQHPVRLTAPFWLADVPVTQAVWQAVMGDNPAHFQGPDHPVENVSWDDAQRFITAASRPGLTWRLPTEAQWEYACRAGTATPRYGDLDAVAWWTGNSGGQTHPVGRKQPNPWGLYDMLGNVWEWCADWAYRRYETTLQVDPAGPAGGSSRVYRGGSWLGSARGVRAAYRFGRSPGYRNQDLGFRLSRGQAAPSPRSGQPRAEPAPPARSAGPSGQARSAGGGARPEGGEAARRPSIWERLFGRKRPPEDS
ncbi:MAG: formylglycine-generating enzyme family protein [Myxococcales bacterium]|nr:formylglycine-generating enzyme family protein [Myxococcales bacterium]